jgi:phage shock protein C
MEAQTPNRRRLTRSDSNRMVGGVAGGLAEYLDVDPTIVRLALVLATLVTGPGVPLLYAIAWFVIPPADRA